MPKQDDLKVSRLLVLFLRFYANMTQSELAKAARLSQPTISSYEEGDSAPSDAILGRIAKAVGVEWELVLHLRRFIEAFLSATSRKEEASLAEPLSLSVFEPALAAVTSFLIEGPEEQPQKQREEAERREAEEIWTALEKYPIPRRRYLIEQTLRASKSPALAMRICEASAQAADRSAQEALELAELAFSIAERVDGEESRHVQGYCSAHVVNARRVAERLGLVG